MSMKFQLLALSVEMGNILSDRSRVVRSKSVWVNIAFFSIKNASSRERSKLTHYVAKVFELCQTNYFHEKYR
jgi:hypothetical protein